MLLQSLPVRELWIELIELIFKIVFDRSCRHSKIIVLSIGILPKNWVQNPAVLRRVYTSEFVEPSTSKSADSLAGLLLCGGKSDGGGLLSSLF
jgi:hypothetical protein